MLVIFPKDVLENNEFNNNNNNNRPEGVFWYKDQGFRIKLPWLLLLFLLTKCKAVVNLSFTISTIFCIYYI